MYLNVSKFKKELNKQNIGALPEGTLVFFIPNLILNILIEKKLNKH